MKNEIGRKLTSLTIMAIMFAGGMAIGVPSFMPEAASDLSVTEGLLTVSATTLQGVAILEIVVNDPDNSDTDNDVTALSASVGGTSYDLTQASNGKWYAYVVDNVTSRHYLTLKITKDLSLVIEVCKRAWAKQTLQLIS